MSVSVDSGYTTKHHSARSRGYKPYAGDVYRDMEHCIAYRTQCKHKAGGKATEPTGASTTTRGRDMRCKPIRLDSYKHQVR